MSKSLNKRLKNDEIKYLITNITANKQDKHFLFGFLSSFFFNAFHILKDLNFKNLNARLSIQHENNVFIIYIAYLYIIFK